jgi:hypothetical protein
LLEHFCYLFFPCRMSFESNKLVFCQVNCHNHSQLHQYHSLQNDHCILPFGYLDQSCQCSGLSIRLCPCFCLSMKPYCPCCFISTLASLQTHHSHPLPCYFPPHNILTLHQGFDMDQYFYMCLSVCFNWSMTCFRRWEGHYYSAPLSLYSFQGSLWPKRTKLAFRYLTLIWCL